MKVDIREARIDEQSRYARASNRHSCQYSDLLMNEVLANVELPYQVRYLPPRARTRQNRVGLSAKRQISIAACSVTEAPVAFRIRQVNGTESGGAPYEIRTFEKKMWWPVLDVNYGLVNADEFLNGLAIGAYDAIKILDPARLWYSGGHRTFEDHFGETRRR